MICEKCKCVIEDDCEICPACGKNPKIPKKYITPITVVALCLCVILAIFSISTAVKLFNIKSVIETTTTGLEVTTINTESYSSNYETQPIVTTSSINTTLEETIAAQFNVNTVLSDAVISKYSLGDSKGASSKHADVLITKNKLKQTTNDEFAAFYNSRVTSDSYAWFTIKCEDGTGIVFFSSKAFAVYGNLNDLGLISHTIGIITLNSDGNYSYIDLNSGCFPIDKTQSTLIMTESITVNEAITESLSSATTYEKMIDITTITSSPITDAPTNSTQNTTEINNSNNHSSTVYVTASGKKYHKDGCSYLNKSKIAIPLSKALAEGYKACARCKP